MNKNDFEAMIEEWKADNVEEMQDLIIDEITTDDNGNLIALAHDDSCTYQLNDDGHGNIVINYLGQK